MAPKNLLDNATKTQIIQQLLASLKPKHGKPSRGIINELATQHNCSRKTISRLWRDQKNKDKKEVSLTFNIRTRVFQTYKNCI